MARRIAWMVVTVGSLVGALASAQRATVNPVDHNATQRFNGKPYSILVNGMVAEAGGGNVVIDAGVRIGGSLTVNGIITGIINGPSDGGLTTTLSGLYVNGNSILDGGLTATGAGSIGAGLYVNGNTVLDGGVTITGTTNLTSLTSTAGITVTSGGLGVTGNSSLERLTVDGGIRTGAGGIFIGATGQAIMTSYLGEQGLDFTTLYPDATGQNCQVSSSATVTGATVKDHCLVSHDNGMDGGAAFPDELILRCFISAADTGKVQACWNANDGGTYDPPPANYYLRTFGF